VTVDIREVESGDRPAINALLRQALGVGDDPRYERFLEWKHRANPFGASFEWVATVDGAIVGYRSFLRWELVADGVVRKAVRAVDTATDPNHLGKGIFRALTLHGVEHLATQDVAWVFNTPNDASRPGYLKMGWTVVGKLPVAIVPRSPMAVRHIRRARQAATRWSEPCTAFEPAVAALEQVVGNGSVAADPARWATNRSLPYLQWRYGFDDLQYRGVAVDGAVVVFRVRRRGPLLEALIADVVGRPERPLRLGAVSRRILRSTGADVAVLSGPQRPRTALSISGPQLTWRPVTDPRVPTLQEIAFSGGDVELF
jgi:hypothetical protein